MRVEHRDGYRVIIGGPVPPQADAITLGRTIVVRDRAASSESLMSHELVHVRQFLALGPVTFAWRYVMAYLRFRLAGWGHMAAYRRIPLEVEASWLSRLHTLAELEPNAGALASPSALRDRLAPRPADAAASSPAVAGGAHRRGRRWHRGSSPQPTGGA